MENTPPPPSAVPGAKSPVLLGLMSNKKVTIALILEILLEFDSKSLKLVHDMKNNHFGSLSIRLLAVSLFLKISKNQSKRGR